MKPPIHPQPNRIPGQLPRLQESPGHITQKRFKPHPAIPVCPTQQPNQAGAQTTAGIEEYDWKILLRGERGGAGRPQIGLAARAGM